MSTLEFNPETFEYKDTTSERIDKKTGKPYTPKQIIQTRKFIPIGYGFFSNERVQFYWHHYKVNPYSEIIQIIAVVGQGQKQEVIGQIQMLAYRNLVQRRYQFPELGFQYSQHKLDVKVFNQMLRSTSLTRYESFYDPNGLQVVITSYDVVEKHRKMYIGTALLYIAQLQVDPSAKVFLDPTPYEPLEQLQEFKGKHNLSQYSLEKIHNMCSRLGFVLDEPPKDENIAIPKTTRLVLNREAPINAKGVRIVFQGDMKQYQYKLSQAIKKMI